MLAEQGLLRKLDLADDQGQRCDGSAGSEIWHPFSLPVHEGFRIAPLFPHNCYRLIRRKTLLLGNSSLAGLKGS